MPKSTCSLSDGKRSFTRTACSMIETWKRIETWLKDNHPAGLSCLNPPVDKEDLEELDELVEEQLPDAFRSLYLIHNGSSGSGNNRDGFIFGLHLLSVNEIIEQWSIWKKLSWAENAEVPYVGQSLPEGAIKNVFFSPLWVPLTHDGSRNHIAIDLDPGSTGAMGQIINFGRDEEQRFVLAESLESFLDVVLANLEQGKVVSDASGLRIKSSTTSNFHDIITEVFGKK